MTKKLYIIGAGGNAEVVLSTVTDINRLSKEWVVEGFFDDDDSAKLRGLRYCGDISRDSVGSVEIDAYFIWTLMSVGIRDRLVEKLDALGITSERFAKIVHPTAVVSESAHLSPGVNIHPLAVIGPGVSLGMHSVVFGQGFVGHDAQLGAFSYVANNASVGARVKLEMGAYIGTNSCVRENVKIGSWSVVGMGSVVLRDVKPGSTVIGCPAKEMS